MLVYALFFPSSTWTNICTEDLFNLQLRSRTQTDQQTSKQSKLVKHHLSVVDAFCKQFIRGPHFLFVFNKFMYLICMWSNIWFIVGRVRWRQWMGASSRYWTKQTPEPEHSVYGLARIEHVYYYFIIKFYQYLLFVY